MALQAPPLYFSLISQPASIAGSQRNCAVLLNFRWAANVCSRAGVSERKKERTTQKLFCTISLCLSLPDKDKWSKRRGEVLWTDINTRHCSCSAPRLWLGADSWGERLIRLEVGGQRESPASQSQCTTKNSPLGLLCSAHACSRSSFSLCYTLFAGKTWHP